MKNGLVLLITVCVVLLPVAVLGGENTGNKAETVLAYEEMPFVYETDEQLDKLLEEIIHKAFEKYAAHPCTVRAKKERKDIDAFVRIGNTESGMIFVKIITKKC